MQTNVGRRLLPDAFYSLGLLCSVGCHRKGGFTDSKGVRTKSNTNNNASTRREHLNLPKPFCENNRVCLTMMCVGRLPTTLCRYRAEALRKPNSPAESRLKGGDAIRDVILPDH